MAIYETFKNIQDAVIADTKFGEAGREQVKRFINQGYADIITNRKREFLDEDYIYLTDAMLAGTCDVTNGSTTVTWTDTSTVLSSTSGSTYKFFLPGTQEVYDVESIGTSTITLSTIYLGETTTGATGNVVQASFNISSSIKTTVLVSHDHYPYTPRIVGPQEFTVLQNARGRQRYGYATHINIDKKTEDLESRLYTYPYPQYQYALKLKCSKYFTELDADDDIPLIPVEYRQILYWYGCAQVYYIQRNVNWYQAMLGNFNKWLGRMDGENKPNQDEPRLKYNYTRRFINPFLRFRNTNRIGPDED